ncbi:hypothetical protein ACE09Y_06650 [Raphidiopsis sp. BLCC-F218]
MERGLFWLPLLGVFFWLAWQGAREYQKVETYRIWAEGFQRSKYDIYGVIGQKDNYITWGKPTPQAIVQVQTFSLVDVEEIRLLIDGQSVKLDQPPNKGRLIELEFIFCPGAAFAPSLNIPFTEIPLAAQWGHFLQNRLQNLPS